MHAFSAVSDPMDCSLPGSSVHGILQARILEWLAISYSVDLPNPGIEPPSLAFPAGGFFTTANTKVFGESLKENEEHTGN